MPQEEIGSEAGEGAGVRRTFTLEEQEAAIEARNRAQHEAMEARCLARDEAARAAIEALPDDFPQKRLWLARYDVFRAAGRHPGMELGTLLGC